MYNYYQLCYVSINKINYSLIIYSFFLKVFLDKLLELNEAGANLSDNNIRDEVLAMIVAVSIYMHCSD